jgi:hypothetical protein
MIGSRIWQNPCSEEVLSATTGRLSCTTTTFEPQRVDKVVTHVRQKKPSCPQCTHASMLVSAAAYMQGHNCTSYRSAVLPDPKVENETAALHYVAIGSHLQFVGSACSKLRVEFKYSIFFLHTPSQNPFEANYMHVLKHVMIESRSS